MTSKATTSTAPEYALGLLDGEELQAARQRVASDPAFAVEIARWRGRLAALAEEVAEEQPPQSAWQRVDRAIGHRGGDNVVILRRRLNVWRGVAGGAVALAASLALVLVGRDIPQPVSPSAAPMVATIKAGTAIAAVASYDVTSRRLIVSEVNMPVQPGHDYQLWLIPAGGKPRSLGVMPETPHLQLALAEPAAAMVARGATLAVSLEPPGGSRVDGPSGPVVASGQITTA